MKLDKNERLACDFSTSDFKPLQAVIEQSSNELLSFAILSRMLFFLVFQIRICSS